MNLRQNVQDLLNQTTSSEVKKACQKYLASLEGNGETRLNEASLFEELKKTPGDPGVAALLTEMHGYNDNIIGMQTKISKAAAQKLAGWGGLTEKTVSNVGEFRDNTMITEAAGTKAAGEELMESLKKVTDYSPETKGVVEAATVADYGVAKGIAKIASSKIFTHPNVKYAAARIQNLLESGRPEYEVVREFVSVFSQFGWDPDVNEALSFPKKALADRASIIEVQSTLAKFRKGDRDFYSEPVRIMNEWLQDQTRNNPALLRDLKAWAFHPAVKELYNKLSVLESNNGKLSLPVKEANCTVSKVYSPILFEKGSSIFKINNRFYRATSSKITTLKESEVNALPASYHALCDRFFNEAVRVKDGDVYVYLNKNKVRITSDKRVFVNEKRIDGDDMGRTLLYYTNTSIFGGDAGLVETCKSLLDNIDIICDIDYAKKLTSNLYEGLSYVVMKHSGKVYLNAVNSSMRSDKFFEATATQAIKAIKEGLGYDISEAFFDILDGEQKEIVAIRKDMDNVMSSIRIVEGEIKKIERAVLDDPFLSEVDEIAEAKATLETELGALHSQWQKLSASLKEAEEKPEVEEEELEEIPTEEAPSEEPEEGEPASDDDTEKKSDDSDIDDGGIPAGTGEPTDDVPPVSGQDIAPEPTDAEPAPSADAIQQSGLLGAEGAQDTSIVGSDHTSVVSATVSSGASAVDAGFIGAEGAQGQATQIPGGADVLNTVGGDANAALTPQIVADTSNLATAPVAPVPVAEPVANDTPSELPAEETPATDELSKGEESEEAEGEEAEEAEEEENELPSDDKKDQSIKEGLGVGTKVKVRGTNNVGEIQSIDKDEFIVMIDGKPQPFKEDQLIDVDKQNIEKEEERKEDEASNEPESTDNGTIEITATVAENDGAVEGEDNEPMPSAAFVKGKINIDFGDFRKGDTIMVEAEGYAKGGDEDPIKLQEPKGNITSVPKKYIQLEEVKASENIEESLKKFETLLSDPNIKVDESLKDALRKIKDFVTSAK